MISEVVMPQMGADMTEGTLIRWLKSEGDEVTRGEIIAEIETDKANVEIEAFESGVFRKALADEGEVVQVGEVIAVIATGDEDISKYNGAAPASAATKPAPASGAEKQAKPSKKSGEPVATTEPAPTTRAANAQGHVEAPAATTDGRLRASPLAKRIAAERGVDLAQIRGTGPGGRIVREDVEGAAAAPRTPSAAPAPAAARTAAATPIAQSRMRQAIARRMSQSKREAPHYYLLIDIDMTDAMAFRAQANDALAEEHRISINDLIVRAAALALQRHPMFNTTIEADQVTQHSEQHVCIGIALDDGLIAPAIVGSGSKSLAEIAASSKDLVARAKGGKLRPDEMSAGTFTISNLGAYGVETLVAIIQPPQTAILGVGGVEARAVVRDGEIVARQVMKVALSADHRVTDGAEGARFLSEIKTLLEKPMLLVL